MVRRALKTALRVLLLSVVACVSASRRLGEPASRQTGVALEKTVQQGLFLEVQHDEAYWMARRLQQDEAAGPASMDPISNPASTTNSTNSTLTPAEAPEAASPSGTTRNATEPVSDIRHSTSPPGALSCGDINSSPDSGTTPEPNVSDTPDTNSTPSPDSNPEAGAADTPSIRDSGVNPYSTVPPGDLTVGVVDTNPDPDDLSLQIVANCGNVLQSLQADFPEFAALITDVLPSVTPTTVTDTFTDPDANITVLMPPRDSARGLHYSFDQGDITEQEVRDVVLVHILAQKLTFQDLVNLPQDAQIDTLLDGSAIKPSLAGATSGSNAGEAGSGSIGLVDTDLDVCVASSTMHTVKALLVPDDVDLPRSADPRSANETDTESGTPKGLLGGDTDTNTDTLGSGAIAGIAAASLMVLVAFVTALCCCLNEKCAASICGTAQKPKKAVSVADTVTASAPGSKIGSNPHDPYANHIFTSGSHPSMSGSPHGSTPGSHIHMHGMGPGPGFPPSDQSASYSQRFSAYSSVGQPNSSLPGMPYVASTPHGSSLHGSLPNTAGVPQYSPPSSVNSWSNAPPQSSAQGSSPAQHGSNWTSMHGAGSNIQPHTQGPHGLTTMGTTQTVSSQLTPPGKDAPADDIKAWVEDQLDIMGETPILGRFVSLGPGERRRGGQAVVQFASSRTDAKQYALKFFLSPEDFLAEKKIYTESPLGALLPRHEGLYDNSNGVLLDARGNKLPPCIIMERGESLDEWSRRRKPDMWAAMPVLANIAKRLEAMHDSGYAHRDLKPANVMWLPRENQWTLIDFGCAAKLDTKAPLSFTLGYASPETINVWKTGKKFIPSQASTDAWSLGVMVYELLTGKPAFDVFLLGRDSVVKQLMGEQPLPWERMSASDRKSLGAFKGPIMQLLNRDPTKRPTMSKFYDNCNAIFSTSTTYMPGKSSMPSSSSEGMHVESRVASSGNNSEVTYLSEVATINGATEMLDLKTETIAE